MLAIFHALSSGPRIYDQGAFALKDWFADWKLVLAMGGAAIAALAMIAYAFFRPAVDEKEAERKRRDRKSTRLNSSH